MNDKREEMKEELIVRCTWTIIMIIAFIWLLTSMPEIYLAILIGLGLTWVGYSICNGIVKGTRDVVNYIKLVFIEVIRYNFEQIFSLIKELRKK